MLAFKAELQRIRFSSTFVRFIVKFASPWKNVSFFVRIFAVAYQH